MSSSIEMHNMGAPHAPTVADEDGPPQEGRCGNFCGRRIRHWSEVGFPVTGVSGLGLTLVGLISQNWYLGGSGVACFGVSIGIGVHYLRKFSIATRLEGIAQMLGVSANELPEQVRALAQVRVQLTQERVASRANVELAERQQKELEDVRQGYERMVSTITSENTSMRQRLNTLEEQISRFKEAVKVVNAETGKLHQENSVFSAGVQRYDDQTDQLEVVMASLTQGLGTFVECYQKLKAEREELTTQVDSVELERVKLETEVKRLSSLDAQLQRSAASLQTVSGELEPTKRELDRIRGEYQKLQESFHKQGADLAKAVNEFKGYVGKVHGMADRSRMCLQVERLAELLDIEATWTQQQWDELNDIHKELVKLVDIV